MPKDTQKVTKQAAVKGDEKKKRSKKDPSAPKRGLSAYMFFSQASRAQIKEDNPEATFGKYIILLYIAFVVNNIKILGQIGKLLGEKWKSMSDAEKKVNIMK
jgi:hypothetical protein